MWKVSKVRSGDIAPKFLLGRVSSSKVKNTSDQVDPDQKTLGNADSSLLIYVAEKERVAENPHGVSTLILKIAASSNPLLLFDPGHECALCSLMTNSGQVRSAQLITEIVSGQLRLGHAALKIFRVRSGQLGSKWISGYSDTFNTKPNLNSGF